MKISFALGLMGLMAATAPAWAANVTFALKAPAGGQVVFSVTSSTGLPKPTVVKKTKIVNGVEYYTFSTSVTSKTRMVCGVYATDPKASSKCVGNMTGPLEVDANFVVLR